ncbi:hypothetical protein [Arthrobacter castelli]|uniref:hypothetical protein n=1 Tax=Arthrobacter castelli TaxID=271431 RepID=UPI0004091DBD|nr:hypothetical protein [Arthrobacter castelli]
MKNGSSREAQLNSSSRQRQSGAEPAADPSRARKKLRAPTAGEVSALGRIGREAIKGARQSARIGRPIPRVGPVTGAGVGAVLSAGHSLLDEADQFGAKEPAGMDAGPPAETPHAQAPPAAARARPNRLPLLVPGPGEPGWPFNPVTRTQGSPADTDHTVPPPGLTARATEPKPSARSTAPVFDEQPAADDEPEFG